MKSLYRYLPALLLLCNISSSLKAQMNLAINGDFSAGDTCFVSGLPLACYSCSATSYCVGTLMSDKCSSWAALDFNDHTTGTGRFLQVDGNDHSPSIVWQQQVSINANCAYTFSFWARNLYSQGTGPFQLEFMAGPSASSLTVIGTTGIIMQGAWIKYSATFHSGTASGPLVIAINQPTAGAYRDFGIDDIYFGNKDTNPSGLEPGSEPKDIAILDAGNNSFLVTGSTGNDNEIQVMDVTGKMVSEGKYTSTQTIDLSSEAKGLYLIRVISRNNVFTRKVIVR